MSWEDPPTLNGVRDPKDQTHESIELRQVTLTPENEKLRQVYMYIYRLFVCNLPLIGSSYRDVTPPLLQ